MDKVTKQFRLQQWALAIQDQKRSGLSVNAWCEEHGVGRDAFFYRQRAVRKALAQSEENHALIPAPEFAEIKLSGSEPAYPPYAVQACIHTACADILLGADAPVELITNILKAVQLC